MAANIDHCLLLIECSLIPIPGKGQGKEAFSSPHLQYKFSQCRLLALCETKYSIVHIHLTVRKWRKCMPIDHAIHLLSQRGLEAPNPQNQTPICLPTQAPFPLGSSLKRITCEMHLKRRLARECGRKLFGLYSVLICVSNKASCGTTDLLINIFVSCKYAVLSNKLLVVIGVLAACPWCFTAGILYCILFCVLSCIIAISQLECHQVSKMGFKNVF